MRSRIGSSKDKRAEMGVGTLIIFVSVILIAAIASSVLIENTDLLKERTEGTGKAAISDVSSTMVVDGVLGLITNDDELDQINIYLRLGAGSPSMDLSQMRVLLSAQSESGPLYKTLIPGEKATDETFTIEWIQERKADTFLDEGEFVKLQIGQNGSAELNLEKGCSVNVVLMPKNGGSQTMELAVPKNVSRGFFDMR